MVISPDDKKTLLDYLNSQKLMSLATRGDYPWIASVYYVVDDDLNLYFISPADAEHSQQLAKNPEVAVNIADSRQEASDKKKGLQLWGITSQEWIIEKLKWMFEMYGRLHPSVKDIFTFERFQRQIMTSKVYKVVPQRIKLFDENLPGNHQKTWE